ncbi:MAG: alpha/beta hydrolase-fold protein [Ignavibacteriales bacterium]|nr:alpha/beta hydrolase-fold protein [Ignavibacteriales bacterium]
MNTEEPMRPMETVPRPFLLVVLLLAAVGWGLAQDMKVSVRVVPPASTPRDAKIFIAGNSPALGNWDPGKVLLIRENARLWIYSTDAPVGSVLEFKITRGSWSSEALYVDGAIPQNTVVKISSDTVITLAPVTWNDLSQSRKNRTLAGGVTGTVRYHRSLKGEGLNFARDILVWLPPSYRREPVKRYPVLYMHDGQNVFDPATSFIGFDWRADEVADSLIRAHAIEDIIIVGINSTPDRMKEYADTELGRKYARFVVDRVKPFIDSRYRTKPSRENTAVMGSSMGGLVSMLFVLWYPAVFSEAACLSSSVGFGIGEKDLEESFNENQLSKHLRIYMDVGELERSLLPGNEALAAFLQKNGYESGKNFEYFVAQGALHNEQAWAHRLWRPLTFLFGR